MDGGPEIWGKEEIFSLPFAQNTKRGCTICGVGSERQSWLELISEQKNIYIYYSEIWGHVLTLFLARVKKLLEEERIADSGGDGASSTRIVDGGSC